MFNKILIIFLLLVCPALSLSAQEFERKQDCLPFDDSSGNKICEEYEEVCRDQRGRFVRCPSKHNINIFAKVERRCRDINTGRFIKCPPKER